MATVPMPFAARAFLSRWGASKEEPRWAKYMPSHSHLTGVWSVDSGRAVSGDESDDEAQSRERSRDGRGLAKTPGNFKTPAPQDEEGRGGDSSALTRAVLGRVWVLSQHRQGCWKVQDAIEKAESDELRELIAEELQGHIWDAIRCPHANHVLQKCITHLRSHALQAVIKEFMSRENAVEEAATHKFGCRILQRLMEHCRPWHLQPIAEDLVNCAAKLSCDPYGNYVMQDFLEHGLASQLVRLVTALEPLAAALGADPHGSAVLFKAMTHDNVTSQDQVRLARALLRAPDIFGCMATSRHGYLTAMRACCLLEGEEDEEGLEEAGALLAARSIKQYAGQAAYQRALN